MNCLKCILCKKESIESTNLLCSGCQNQVRIDPEAEAKYRSKLQKFEEKIKKYQIENLSKCSKEHNKAYEIIKKIADKFGYKAKKEKAFPPFMCDIYLQGMNIAIEIDGGYHSNRFSYDETRDQYIKNYYGADVYRFDNEVINTHNFKNTIWNLFFLKYSEKLELITTAAHQSGVGIPLEFRTFINKNTLKSMAKEVIK